MATIKTTGSGSELRIITKTVDGEVRVSCECCEEIACCMYPAQGLLDGIYLRQDLPEIVFAYGQTDSPYTIVFSLVLGGGEAIYESSGNRIAIIDNLWEPQGFDEGIGQWVGFQDTQPNPCLIFEPTQEGLSFIGDDFEDTYTVTTPFSSGTVTRQSLCLWDGVDDNGCPLQLIYGGFGSDPETEPPEGGLKWSVSFFKFESPVEGQPAICTVSYGRLKSGLQNSPTGTYDITYATEGPESATVSQI